MVGKIAHIHGESPGGPRYNPDLCAAERNAPENLIFLCPVHHDIVDTQVSDYPAARLRQMKEDHEAAVARQMGVAIADVSFSELEVVCRHVMNGSVIDDDVSFAVIDLNAKMAINGLTRRTAALLTIGLAGSRIVADYVARMDGIDPGFAERLRAGFVREYKACVANGLRGDVLFTVLWDFASQGSEDFQRQAAGLAALTYFFEACDIFERAATGSVV